MKYTLLEIVQDILNDMDSDPVNSINDTIESQQVAQIVKTCYNKMMSNRNWPHQRQLIQLNSSGSAAKPTYLKSPDGMKELIFFKYDKKKLGDTKIQLQDVTYKTPDDFLRYVSSRNSEADNVVAIADFSGSQILVFNDRAPTYWTSFDDDYVVCDSYDNTVDSTLQKSKTQCLAYMEASWTHTDSAIPNIPEEAFAALIEDSKSTAFLSLKQMPNEKAETESQRQNRWLSRKAWKVKGGLQYPDYGRKSRK